MKGKRIAYFEKAAEDSRYNAGHWLRYLRKEVSEHGSRFSSAEIKALMNSKVLSMFQKLAVKRAATKGSGTHTYLLSLNQRATTSMLDAVREKMEREKTE